MRIVREWIQRLQGTLFPGRRDADLEHELRSHMEMAAEDARRRGLDPDDASRAARIEAGGASQAMDALRDQRGLPWLDDLARDVQPWAAHASAHSRVHGGRAPDAGTGNRREYGHLLDRQRRDPASARLSQTGTADVSDHGVSGARIDQEPALGAGVLGVPADQSIVCCGRGVQNHGWGLHNRRSQPHGRQSTSARAVDICRRPPAQHAWRSAGAGTLLQRGRNRSCRGPGATARDSLVRSCGKRSLEDNHSLDKP